MPVLGNSALAVAMIAAFILAVAGTRLLVKDGPKDDRKRGGLMLAAAAVLVANVLIWVA